MSKLVFVDVDDTILSPPYEAMRKVLKTIGRRFPTEEEVLNRKHIDFFDSYPDIFRTKTQMWLSVFLSLLFGYFRSQKLLKFDKENLGEQLKDNRVYLISKNPPSFTRWRVLRLKALLGVNVGDRYIACGPIFKKGKKKIEIIREIANERGVDLTDCLLIDDSIENLKEAIQFGVSATLIASSWNSGDRESLSAPGKKVVVIGTEEIPSVIEAHLHETRPGSLNGGLKNNEDLVYILPPISIAVIFKSAYFFLKRRFLFSTPIPKLSKIIPIARNQTTSIFFNDPHRVIHSRLKKVLFDEENPKFFGIVFPDGKSCRIKLLDSSARELRGSSQPGSEDLAVRLFRKRCRELLEGKGFKLSDPPLFYFSGIDKKAEIERVLKTPTVMSAIEEYIQTTKTPRSKAEQMARRYAVDTCTYKSYLGCLLGHVVMKTVMKKVFRSVKAQFSEKIPALEKDHFLIYASIHRSYLDSGILYAVLANHRMDFPLAVSADKMKKMWMGKLGAFAGVFFIQRKYVDEIYSAILSEHVNYLQKNAFSMEIFLEGQRSRSGLTLPPKKGIARMVWQNLEESSSKKVAIVPVSFSYSKLPESEALLKESFEERVKDGSATLRETADMMVKGTMRKSTFKKFRAGIRKLRSPGVSECLINFGDPIVLERSSVMDKKSSEIALQNYLNQVMFKINSMTSILPSSVLCLGISCADFYHMKALDALKFLEITKGILSAYHIEHLQDGLDQASFEEQLRSFLSLPFVNRKFKKVGIKNTPIVAMSDLDIERSSYYKNNIVHFFVLPGLLANVLMEYRQGRIEELNRFLGHMFNQLVIKYFLPLTMDSKIYIERCLEIFHRFHLVTLDDKLYNVNFECESINTLILLARFGDSLVQEDLFEIFESFRRSFKRIDLDAQAQFSVLKRNTALEGAVLRVSEEVFSLKCLELLEVGDEVQVVSSRQDSLSCVGTVVQASKETYELKQLPIQIGSELKDLPPLTPDSIQFKRAIHLPGDVKNISASGAFIVTEGNFRKGDLLIGELQNGNLRFQFEGMVTRIGKGAIGLRFENLTPEKQAELVLFTSKALAERKPLMEVA